jgi:AcrR family transcriptional regulator
MKKINKTNKMEEIYDTALKLFVADGYDQTPLSRIAKALGVSKAGLYHYFSSKEDLLFFIHDWHLKNNLIPMLDAAERIPDPEERIAFFINSYTKKLMAADAATRVLVHENRRLKPAHQEKIKSVWRRVLNLIRDAFSEMEAMGKIRRTNKTFAAFAALGMCSWTFYWFDYDRKQSAQELADTYVQILLKGLKKEC